MSILTALPLLALAALPHAAHAQDTPPAPSAPPPGWQPVDGATAPGQRWIDLPIQQKVRTDGTAWTVGKGHVRLGLFKQTWGVLDNADLSTNAGLWLLGLPNGSAEITAIQTRHLDVGVRAGATWLDLERLSDIPEGKATLVPVGVMGSLLLGRRASVHLGGTWNIFDASGEYTTEQLAQGIATATGVSLDPALLDVLQGIDDSSDIYAGAHVVLTQSHLDADVHINRRDSLVLRTTTFLMLQGSVQGGYRSESSDENSVTAEIGPSARLTIPLQDQLSVLSSISYQASFKRLQVRVGLPLVQGGLWIAALPQAFSLSWTLGPMPDERAALSPAPAAPSPAAPSPAAPAPAP